MKEFFGIKDKIHIAMLVLIALFFISSIYLTYLKYTSGSTVCDISAVLSCSKVGGSEYSVILGVPLPLLGLAYAFFNLAFYFLKHNHESRISKRTMEILINVEVMINTFGALAALTFLFLQFFEIKAICIFCLVFDFSTLIYTALVYKEFTSKNSK